MKEGIKIGIEVTLEGSGRVKASSPDGSVEIISSKKSKKEFDFKKRPKEGVIESLVPLFERASEIYPQIIGSQAGDWVTIREQALYDYEKAINLQRKHRFSVDETTEHVMEMGLNILGIAEMNRQGARDIMWRWLENEIRSLYISTTESKRKNK